MHALNTMVCSQKTYLLYLAYWSCLWGMLEQMPWSREGTRSAVLFCDLGMRALCWQC